MAKGFKTGGREPGTPNKITKDVKEVYQELLEKNFDNLNIWLQKVAKDHPDKALNFIIRLSEFVVPRLQSTKQTTSHDYSNMTDEELDELLNSLKIK